jgi:hypothetical protein
MERGDTRIFKTKLGGKEIGRDKIQKSPISTSTMAMASFCPESEVDDDGDFHSKTPIRATQLGASAQEFLNHLRLPLMHPFCPGYATEDDDDVSAGDGNNIAAVGEADTDEMMDLLSRIGTGSIFELPNKRIDDMYFNIDKTTTTLEADSDDADANISGFGHEAIAPSQLLTSHLHRQLLKQQQQPASPIIGPISLLELHDHSISEVLVTATTMSAPTLAMMELWLRFFAVFLCPLCLCYMIQWEIKLAITNNTKPCRANDTTISTTVIAIYLVGLASSAVLFTDTLYVYEYGRWFGFALFVLSSVMAIRCATFTAAVLERSSGGVRGNEDGFHNNKGVGKKLICLVARRKIFLFRCVIALLISTTTIVFLRSDGGHAMEATIQRFIPLLSSTYYQPDNNLGTNSNTPHLEQLVPKDPGIDLPTIKEGLYHSSSNPLITSIVSHWPESSRTYTVANGATSYLVNGDQRTGIPFLVNKVEEEEYVRVWTQNKFDGEYLALDIAFPYSDSVKEGNMDDNGDGERQHHFVHDYTKPVYLVLHGLNGGSHEEYVKDLVKRRRSEGSTVLVLIARGMMDTKLVGWNAFHGARTGDIDAAARAIRRGLIALAEAHRLRPDQRQILAGVGYSMGERWYCAIADFSGPYLAPNRSWFLLHRCHHSIQLCCSFRKRLRTRCSNGH